MRVEGTRLPDLVLEQYALGELPGPEAARVAKALRRDDGLRLRLEEIQASNATILEESPPAQIAAAIRRRLLSFPSPAPQGSGRGAGSPRFIRASGLLFTAAAAVLVLAGTVLGWGLLFPSFQDLSRPKGGAPALSIYKKAASGPEELRDGASVAAGDVLQIRYSAAASRHGAIFSLDGAGILTAHLPESGRGRSPLLAAGGAALGSAYELDAAPGFERFFILSSTRDFDVAAAAKALGDVAALGPGAARADPRLPPGIEWKSFLLLKTGGQR